MTDEQPMNEERTTSPEATDPIVDEASGAGAVATEADGGADGGASSPEGANKEFDALRAEMDALNDRHLRLAAEFDNYRKRNERERAESGVRAQAELAGRLLEALDDLQRVAAYEEEKSSVEALLEGVRLVEKKLRHVLESAGLEPIEAEGEFFNPATMEALMTLPAEREEDDELVADVFQKGYRFGDMLIRPARVRVRKYEPEE